MPEIHLMNVKNKFKIENAVYVNCMRPGILSNPFYMKTEDQRDLVLQKFKRYIWKQMQNDTPVNQELNRLAQCDKPIVLICCCIPKPCHTQIIKNAIEYLRKK